ncbi:glycosyl transferase, family 2 [Thermoproteus uzoniensis 768-20]|uniref:Glycosyl transferase, family 2 n=1 Tax=Thermoproteus uzoniensis (strain 768-20) TaxID=999630 RepID=F2L0P4_THEU7|nr:glycosyl transferase, family 2 [Thermoproteus uzoniensis 768-20]
MVIVVKNVEVNGVEKVCTVLNLNCIVLEQRVGYFTHALNMGRRAATGDIVVFTDDDAIALSGWLKRYSVLFKSYGDKIGCISSRDIYLDIQRLKLLPTPDDKPHIRLYRTLLRPVLEKPIPWLSKYWCGVYLDRNLHVKHGSCIPSRECYSLPFRGVNMAFRKEAIENAEFPEHPKLRRAPGNEQYVGIQLILNGWDCVYTPNNPILHMFREESLSRGKDSSYDQEVSIMRLSYWRLLRK